MIRQVPEDIGDHIRHSFGRILAFQAVSGGSINHAGKIETSSGAYFVKWNDTSLFPGMFQAEARGLQLLKSSGAVRVPAGVQVIEGIETSGLICEYVETVRGNQRLWEAAGESLAKIHVQKAAYFGLDHDNYMGSLPQSNKRHEVFPYFFLNERIRPQVKLARDHQLLDTAQVARFENLKLYEHFADETPWLVHGDLWGGNIIFDSVRPWYIDPAVAWSSRFVDLSMTTMFGLFPESFYHAYKEVYPYTSEQEKAWEIIKLYPLLIHVNLFGAGYLHETLQILNHFT